MKLGTALLVAHDFIEVLVGAGVLLPNGDMLPPDISQDVKLAAELESILKKYGLTVQENIDKVIQILPLVLQMAGVK